MKKIIGLLLLLLFFFPCFAETIIYGNAKDYANSTIIFYKYSDRITYQKEKLFELEIDANGDFYASTNISTTTYTFATFGVYYAYFYIQNNNKYELLLPRYVEKTQLDIFNPFFEAENIHLGIKNLKDSDLNYLIMDFDYYYERFLSYYINSYKIITDSTNNDIKEFIYNIDEKYKNCDNKYFKQYLKFRIASLDNLSTQSKNANAIALAYYAKSPVLYNNPAYMDLFNEIFDSYFDNILTRKEGPTLYAIINYGHSIKRLNAFLSQINYLQNTQLREMVIMKGLYDCFYNKNMSWLPLLLTLDSLNLSTKYQQHKLISQNIADDVISLKANTYAPNFELHDTNNNNISLKDFRGKYVYLQFANTNSIASQKDLELIKKLFSQFNQDIIFITILSDDDREKALSFIKRNKYYWNFLFCSITSQVISDYKIISYPNYFLINPDGTFNMSPAPSPTQKIEKKLLNLTNSDKTINK